MTLKELIQSDPENLTRTDEQVLEWLKGGSGQYRSTYVDARSIMAQMGARKGATFLSKLEAIAPQEPAVRWALKFLEGLGIDIANPETRGMVLELREASVITADEASAVLAMASELSRLEAAGIVTISQTAFVDARKS